MEGEGRGVRGGRVVVVPGYHNENPLCIKSNTSYCKFSRAGVHCNRLCKCEGRCRTISIMIMVLFEIECPIYFNADFDYIV